MKVDTCLFIDPVELPLHCEQKAMSTHDIGMMIQALVASVQSGSITLKNAPPFIVGMKRGYVEKPYRYIPKAIRDEVLAAGKCAHCDSTVRLEVDHIKPVVMGGTNARKNLQCLCEFCNCSKGGRWIG